MTNWHCFRCKEEMIDDQLMMTYLEIEAPLEGLACPKCGAKYVTEEVAVGKLARGEKMIEDK